MLYHATKQTTCINTQQWNICICLLLSLLCNDNMLPQFVVSNIDPIFISKTTWILVIWAQNISVGFTPMKPHICLLWTTPNQSCLAQICHWDIRTQCFTYIILAYLLWVFFWEGLLRQDVFFRETWCTAVYTYNSEPHCALWTHRFNVQNHSQQQPAKYKSVLIETSINIPYYYLTDLENHH